MILSFKRDMTHNYMVTESEETLPANDYQIHMLTEHHIGGLLNCSVKKVNGKGRYFYDITSRQSMENIYEKEYISAGDVRVLLKGLYTALTEAKKYLLDTDKVVLEPGMIYMDIETKEPLFCYLPVYEGSLHASFTRLSEYIMRRLDQTDSSAVLLGYEIYRQSLEENYSLERLLKQVAFGTQPAREGQQKKSEPVQEIYKEPVQPFHRMTEVQESHEEDTRKETAKAVPEEQAKERKKRRQRKETGSKKSGEKRRKKGKGAGEAVLAVLLAAGTLSAAAWFWKLDMTQLGGIAFLLVCLIGYGFSVETKRRKKEKEEIRTREDKADRQSVKKIQSMREPAYKAEKNNVFEPGEQKESDIAKTIGATVLLDKGEEEYEPHLSLISMNPRERNSIVLLNDSYTIGKLKNKTDICIDNPSISRIHAKILREGKDYYLCDLNSTNGTFVNGRRLAVNERVLIQLSDEIRFADLGYYVGKC